MALSPLFGTFLDPAPRAGTTPALTSFKLASALGCTVQRAEFWRLPIEYALMYAGCSSVDSTAAFLAQVGHETLSLRYIEEIWGPTAAQRRYQTHPLLGNTEPGDGYRYRGRGLIQTTGRANYRTLARRLAHLDCPDFEARPDTLVTPKWASMSAADYWRERGLNRFVAAGDFEGLTKAINGGLNGLEDRQRRFKHALEVLS